MMFASFKKKYFLSDKGMSGVKRGVFWTCVTNLVTMAGMAFLFQVMDGFVKHLTEGADLPGAVPFAIGLAVFFCCRIGSSTTTPTAFSTRNAAISESRSPSASANCRFRSSGGATWRI